ncbi:hypothetical protein KY333_03260, partial [Candidatus Woesearchaeota archaeon]|nr:hypothetical protein [Candidatus Woesearchaeota archaeon]
SGFLYSGNNGHHAIAFYKIPAGITMSDETDPIFTVIGTDLTACLRDAATGLIQTEKKHPKKWEVYTVDVADLERIKEKLKYGTSTKDGIQFSVHRTPLIDIIEQNTPKSESDAQESELEILKKNILERYENTPVNPQ